MAALAHCDSVLNRIGPALREREDMVYLQESMRSVRLVSRLATGLAIPLGVPEDPRHDCRIANVLGTCGRAGAVGARTNKVKTGFCLRPPPRPRMLTAV
jgi:hypothetical protein